MNRVQRDIPRLLLAAYSNLLRKEPDFKTFQRILTIWINLNVRITLQVGIK